MQTQDGLTDPTSAPRAAQSALTVFLQDIWHALDGDRALLKQAEFGGEGDLPSAFAVSDLAAASIGAAALAVCELVGAVSGRARLARIDRRLASFWFAGTLKPEGWSLPPIWDSIAGDYATSEGWIRLHTNAPHHRAAALAVLGTAAEKEAVTASVRTWRADELEAAIVAQGGCAAAMRSQAAWAKHRQGSSVAAEPLVWREQTDGGATASVVDPSRPLAGIRVLDMTRVLAGPVATRFLAGFGADVLRIDPPFCNEPAVVPDVTLGKRCARLDLRDPAGRERLLALLAGADIIVHGYRPDALERLGLGVDMRRRVRPGLIDVSLDAYGWTGPWAGRRGFDSLVQMSSGIAETGMRQFDKDRPTPLPVQALDHATGYIMAAAAVRGLSARLARGVGARVRTSLARTAALLCGMPSRTGAAPLAPRTEADFCEQAEATPWGPARRLSPPVVIDHVPMRWDRPAADLGSSPPNW